MNTVTRSVTHALRMPTQLHLHIVDADDVLADQSATARLFARRFREELDFIEDRERGMFGTPVTYMEREAGRADH